MFAITCEECDRTYLVSASSIEALYSIEPGVIVVEVSCLRGHPVRVVTGNAAPAPAQARAASAPSVPLPRTEATPDASGPVPDRVPRLWSAVYTARPGIVARAYAWLAAKLNIQAWMYRRFDYRLSL
jgi:hypothetical protein